MGWWLQNGFAIVHFLLSETIVFMVGFLVDSLYAGVLRCLLLIVKKKKWWNMELWFSNETSIEKLWRNTILFVVCI